MTTRKAYQLVADLQPLINHSTSYIRKIEVDEEDRSIKLINLFNGIMHRVYYSYAADALDVAYEILDYLTDRPGFFYRYGRD